MHSCIEPSLYGLDFFLELRLVSDNNLLRGAAHVIAVDTCARVCVDKWRPTAAPSLVPRLFYLTEEKKSLGARLPRAHNMYLGHVFFNTHKVLA